MRIRLFASDAFVRVGRCPIVGGELLAMAREKSSSSSVTECAEIWIKSVNTTDGSQVRDRAHTHIYTTHVHIMTLTMINDVIRFNSFMSII